MRFDRHCIDVLHPKWRDGDVFEHTETNYGASFQRSIIAIKPSYG